MKDKQKIMASVEPDLKAQVVKFARDKGFSESDLVRLAVKQYLRESNDKTSVR